jgi:hypothetical protein
MTDSAQLAHSKKHPITFLTEEVNLPTPFCTSYNIHYHDKLNSPRNFHPGGVSV